MNLGAIKMRARQLNGTNTTLRWTDAIMNDNINQAQMQTALEVDFPTATQAFPNVQPPPQPTVTVHGATGSTTISYAIVAVGSTGGGDSVPSPTTTIADANATLSPTNYNAISWASVPGTTYKVLRQYNNTQPFVAALSMVTATGTATTFNDNGAYAGTTYLIQRGNEIQIPEIIKFLHVLLITAAGNEIPLVPYDTNTLNGILRERWDNTSGTILGAPQYTPQWLAQGAASFPITGPIGGRVPVSASWQNTMNGNQDPGYYLRGGVSGGFLGVLPPPQGQYLVQIDFLPKPLTLQQNADVSLFPDAFMDAICYKTLAYMSISDDNSRSEAFDQLWMQECRRRRISHVDTMQGDKPHALVPLPVRTEMRSWPT